MRINAHFASAILPTDKAQWDANDFYMKKPSANIAVIKAQKDEILLIKEANDTNFTAIARRVGVVPSTINRFMADKEPSNALSAVTMKKVRDAWAYKTETKNSLNDAQLGIMSALDLIFGILTLNRLVKPEDLESILTHDLKVFRMRNQLGAIEVTEGILNSLGLRPHESRIQAIHRLLQHPQA